jgi:hypothetical protein
VEEPDTKMALKVVEKPKQEEEELTERIRNAYSLFKRWIKTMGSGEMGRHWSAEEERQVSTMRKVEGEQKEISEMRPTCKSHTNDKVAKGECCQTKKSSW